MVANGKLTCGSASPPRVVQGCNSIDILGLAQFRAQNLAQNVAQVLSDRNAGILDLRLLGPALIQ